MTAGFAGSRSLNERRRRRIAGETDPPPADEPPSQPRAHVPAAPARSFAPRLRRRLPLRLIIPPDIWKHSLAAALLALVCGGAVWLGVASERVGEALGPYAGEFVGFSAGRLTDFLGGTLLAAAAQLSLLIWWVRSRSRGDFSGRYRIWRWTAPAAFLAAMGAFIDLHVLWGRTIVWASNLQFPHAELLCWLAPAVGCGSVLLRDIAADMRGCRTSSVFLRLAVLGWSAATALLLGAGGGLSESVRAALIVSAALGGHYCLFVGLLFHARYVIFVSAEPPPVRASLTRRLWTRLAGMRAARREKRRQRRATAISAQSPGKPSESTSPPATGAAVAGDSANGTGGSSRPGKTVRVDAAHSTDDLAGKTKRRRKRKKRRTA